MKARGGSRWGAIVGLLTRDDCGERIMSVLRRRKVGIILGLGAFVRIAQYLADRPLWLDEGALAENIRLKTLAGLFGPLARTQLAPAGFLVVEWITFRGLGETRLALRFFPLVCGIASLFLFLGVARRHLKSEGVWIALGLFAVSDDLIYYASEVKPYSTDVAMGLVCYLMAESLATRPLTVVRLAASGAIGAAVVWFSFPSVFILAGLATVVVASALGRREWRRAALLLVPGILWAVSFAAVHAVSREQLGHRLDMWAFWNSAFAPWPLEPGRAASWIARSLIYLFVNPLSFETPAGPWLSALAPLGLFVAGCVSLWKRDRAALGMLTLPTLFTLLAACLHRYPFHGRLLLFLVPSLLILIADGAAWACEASRGKAIRAAVLGALFLFPTLDVIVQVLQPRDRGDFNPYGDRRPARVDPDHFPFWAARSVSPRPWP